MRLLAFIGALAILCAIGAAAYVFGGYYSVAARIEDPALIQWALIRARTNSIAQHATDPAPPGLDDPARVQAGARAFAARGCANCHGGPGVEWAKFSEGLNPAPPDLKDVVGDLTAPQLFWVVKNGIRMTGMPSFGAVGVPDDEIWSIAAFLKKLPEVSEADYKAWTATPAGSPSEPSPGAAGAQKP